MLAKSVVASSIVPEAGSAARIAQLEKKLEDIKAVEERVEQGETWHGVQSTLRAVLEGRSQSRAQNLRTQGGVSAQVCCPIGVMLGSLSSSLVTSGPFRVVFFGQS